MISPDDFDAAFEPAGERTDPRAKHCGCGPLEPCTAHLDRSPLPPDPDEIADAARLFCETWTGLAQDLPDIYGCTLSCAEANVLADLYRATGDDGTADAVIAEHAAHDQPGDSHYREAARA